MDHPVSTPRARLGLRSIALLALVGLFGMFLSPVLSVRADNVHNDVVAQTRDTSIEGGVETTVVGYFIQALGGADPNSGCNATVASPAVVTIVTGSGITAAPNSLTFTDCGDAATQTVTFSAAALAPGAADVDRSITVTVSDSGLGTYNTSPASFVLTVEAPPAPPANTAPALSLPSNISGVEATGPSGAAVTFSATATDTEDGALTPTCSAASGSTFPLGTTTVNCSVTDTGGLTATGSFTVTVVDTTAPALTLPGDTTRQATGPGGKVVNYAGEGTPPSAVDLVDGTVAVTCSPASGSTFPIGTTTVNCSATDAHSNTRTGSFNITVEDTTGPVVTVPDDITVEATGASGAVVTFTASAEDAVDGSRSVTCSPASGSTFPLGSTTVTCTATDTRGNPGQASFDVIVQDTTDPVLALPDDITEEATSASGAVVSFTASASDAVDGDVSVSCDPTSGSTFALGETTVTCEASDAAGNTASGSFTVTVEDTTAPVIAAHGNETAEATSASGAAVTYAAPATSDAVDGPGTATCTPATGSTFTLGTTTVTCNATDTAGNAATATTFTVSVVDTTAPVIAFHANVTAEATSASGAAVSYTSPATSDAVDGAGTATCSPASGSTFALGTTTVTCNATDAAGNAATATTFDVIVRDTTAPVIAFHANVSANPTSITGAVVTYTAPATSDAVDGPGTATCSPASGTTFAIGPTPVTCTATDAAGNAATATTFTVTVNPLTIAGFFAPVDMGGVYNTVKGGSTVPLKFKVYAGTTDITATVPLTSISFSAVKTSCTSGAPEDAIEEFYTTGGTSLRYDATSGQLIQNWQTPKAAGSCYSMKVTVANAGTPTVALFKLK